MLYAWQSFVALNWPALSGQRGVPDPAKVIGQPGGVVWHTWKTPDEIFYPDGQAPPPWNQYGGQLPPQCVSVGATSNSFVLQRTSKVPGDINNAAIQAAKEAVGGTLTDQHGNLARYEVRLNQATFNAIVGPKYYTVQAQDNASEIAFAPGVMEVKAAWREITSADPPSVVSRYYTETAWIYTPPFGTNPPTCVKGTVGLVGLHVTQKTPTRPAMDVGDLRADRQRAAAGIGVHAVLSPSTTRTARSRNARPTRAPRTTVFRLASRRKSRASSQSDRPPPRRIQYGRQTLRQAVAASPFQYYQLIDIQWPQTPSRFPVGNPTPGFLANTVMETYVTESSCVNCHFTARTQSGKLSSDYSFMLAEAQPGTSARTPR